MIVVQFKVLFTLTIIASFVHPWSTKRFDKTLVQLPNPCIEISGTYGFSRLEIIRAIPKIILPSTAWSLFSLTAASVTMQQPSERIFKVGEALGIERSKARFQDARMTLDYLVKNYDTISKDGGDNIRRYLGTVGTTSALYGIGKVLRELQEEAKDIVEYTENLQDFEYWLRAADTAAYSAMFVEYSAANTKPEKYILDAKIASERMKRIIDSMALEINF